MSALPEWLDPGIRGGDGFPRAGAPRGRRILRRSLGAFAGLLARLAAGDSIPLSGPLARLDARAKILGFLGLAVLATFLRSPTALAAALLASLAFAAAAGVFERRLAGAFLAVPLLSALVVLPATLNVVSPGDPLWVLWRGSAFEVGPWVLPPAVGVTGEGLLAAGRLLLRTTACAALTLSLAASTRPVDLFRGLRALAVPQSFVMVLGMMVRYLALLARAAEEIHLARLSRTLAVGELRREQAWAAAGMGSLYRRSRALAEEVSLAMASRGYGGEARALRPSRLGPGDALFLSGCAALGAALLLCDGGFR